MAGKKISGKKMVGYLEQVGQDKDGWIRIITSMIFLCRIFLCRIFVQEFCCAGKWLPPFEFNLCETECSVRHPTKYSNR